MAFTSASQHSHHEIHSEINVTPLVDVMLVLLVIFIVTAPLLTNSIPINLPKTAATASPEAEKPLVISINDRGDLFVGEENIPPERLEARLISAREADAGLQVQLRASEAVNYGVVAKSLVSVERAGISKVAVITAR
ncbi:biopolymer transporter ExbD [Brenneria roseae subsp. roseae]|uniref:ExbD/TolR family protein n=1 Tax=Brenneria roseae TaxID=1509241 RepID=UPI000D615BB2|nr:biopolymer transporter ExbD [Brenneria roseae]PWC17516.1 biopolymer transporter ExbD [Brenneria roseae subsp. roseae]